jgi:ketosteroid isomerase-like protein
MTDIDTVRASFDAYRSQDAAAAHLLLSPDFRFTSPQDDHLDRDEWMERCFPTADRFSSQELLEVVSTPHGVIVVYEYELADGGGRFRNAELIRVEHDLIVETQVFFGGGVG